MHQIKQDKYSNSKYLDPNNTGCHELLTDYATIKNEILELYVTNAVFYEIP